jgi:cytoskeletal protein RodZ
MDTPGHELASGSGADQKDAVGLGNCLRKEREKKGLTHADLFETTRLQVKFLEALEDEAWDRIPNPAFIRGFVLAYGKALGLGQKQVLDLYARTAVPGIVEPAPPLRMERPWKLKAFLGILTIVCVAVGLYFLVDFLFSKPASVDSTAPGEPAPSASQPTADDESGGKEGTSPPTIPGQVGPSPAPSAPRPGEEMQDPGPSPEPSKSEPPEAPDQEKQAQPSPVPGAPDKVLRVQVSERTWIRIVVDDEAPREYIFKPGSRPEWKARRGFDLLIGNAGGVELDFGGKKWGPLGPPGKVVRLRLPGGDEGRRVQD